jgi:hypothetical protein
MKKYDQEEKIKKQNEEFIRIVKNDNKLLTFFV